MATPFSIKADNGMFWSYKTVPVYDKPNITTLALTADQSTSFTFHDTGDGGAKYIIMYAQSTKPGVYLRWDSEGLVWDGKGAYAAITPSTFPSTTEWKNIPQNERMNLSFIYETVDNRLQFKLIPLTSSITKGTTYYLKRVSGGSQYVAAQIQNDNFGNFTKVYPSSNAAVSS